MNLAVFSLMWSQLAPRSRGRDADPLTGGRDNLGPSGGIGVGSNGNTHNVGSRCETRRRQLHDSATPARAGRLKSLCRRVSVYCHHVSALNFPARAQPAILRFCCVVSSGSGGAGGNAGRRLFGGGAGAEAGGVGNGTGLNVGGVGGGGGHVGSSPPTVSARYPPLEHIQNPPQPDPKVSVADCRFSCIRHACPEWRFFAPSMMSGRIVTRSKVRR